MLQAEKSRNPFRQQRDENVTEKRADRKGAITG